MPGVLGAPGPVDEGRREEVRREIEAEALDELREVRDRERDESS
jgi:hypothetical protein